MRRRRPSSISIVVVIVVVVASSLHRCAAAFAPRFFVASSSSSSSSYRHRRRADVVVVVVPRAEATTSSRSPSSSAAAPSGGSSSSSPDDDDGGVIASSSSSSSSSHGGDCFVGFDLGTSGARMSIVERRRKASSTGDGDGGGGGGMWAYGEVIAESLSWDDDAMRYDDADAWNVAVRTLLSRCADDGNNAEIMGRIRAVCVSGTSASCLLVDRDTFEVTRSARMYNYDITSPSSSSSFETGGDPPSPAAVERVMDLLNKHVPPGQTARASTGSLAKLLLWNEQRPLAVDDDGSCREVLCHQSDYVSMSLMREGLLPPVVVVGPKNDDDADDVDVVVDVATAATTANSSSTTTLATTTSDWHNCLKLGYDVRDRTFPPWMIDLLGEAGLSRPDSVLPSRVASPGAPIGALSTAAAAACGLPPGGGAAVVVVGGTTDSNAAFFAAAGSDPEIGTAVTSLGSTLAIKMLSRTYVEDASRGVYSHRFPRFGTRGGRGGGDDGDDGDGDEEEEEAWLIGGASNVGCAVLRREGYTDEELARLSADIDPSADSPLSYYPLTKRGERFPIADGAKEPVLSPRPDCRREYLHAILQGISDVERDGYGVLGELGATPRVPAVVLSCGGGAKNDVWTAMRERRLMEICEKEEKEEEEIECGQRRNRRRRVEVRRATNTEASYGAALLAAASFAHEGSP